jgi:hypothetical protein
MNDYETRRLAKIAKNQALLAELDIKPVVPQARQSKPDGEPVAKRRKVLREPLAPSRASARIANTPAKPDYNEDIEIRTVRLPRSVGKKSAKRGIDTEVEALVPVKDVDEIQAGWTAWTPTAAEPTRDEDGVFHFEDMEDFTPNKSPEEMIREGIHGGSYFRPLKSRKLGIVVEGDWHDLPESWISCLNVERYLTNPAYDPEINKFHVACGQSIEEWEAAGWISHDHDVRGWFQWYYRFYLGRRCDDDGRQVSRWRKCVGETGRFKRALLKQYGRAGIRTMEVYGDEDEDDQGEEMVKGISPVVSQTCFHWAFEVRQADLDRFWGSA